MNRFVVILLCICAAVCCVPVQVSAEEKPFFLQTDSIGTTLETISVSSKENLSLAGISYLVRGDDLFYLGLSAYGAVFGERGGFFTGGFTGGISGELSWRWKYDIGLFLGGGGGGSAPQGGGMMVRPHASFSRIFDGWDAGIGASYVYFPNGDISSYAVFAALSFDVERAVIPGRLYLNYEMPVALEEAGWRYSISHCWYHPSSDSLDLTGQPYKHTIGLIGAEADYFSNDSFYLSTRAYGAWAGGIDGYAKILFGPCISVPVVTNKRFRIEGGVLFGAAGGGGVDTGGGILVQPEIGMSLLLAEGISIQLKEGFLRTYDGDLNTYVTTFGLSHEFTGYTVSPSGISGLEVRTMPWRLSGSIKAYIPPSGISDKSGDSYEPGILLAGMMFDRFINSRVYLCTRAYGAVTGGVGGYAEGFWGAGFIPLVRGDHSLSLEILVGAGGGGGVDVASGCIGQMGAGYEYMFSDVYSFMFRCGYMQSFSGTFETVFAETGFSFSFGQMVKP